MRERFPKTSHRQEKIEDSSSPRPALPGNTLELSPGLRCGVGHSLYENGPLQPEAGVDDWKHSFRVTWEELESSKDQLSWLRIKFHCWSLLPKALWVL